MADFTPFIAPLLKREGGYVNDKDDSGGETKWGITIAVAREFGYTGDMKDLTKEQATEIYAKMYWKPNNLDKVKNQSVAEFIGDVGVNMGIWRAAIMTQYILNKFFGKNLDLDGKMKRLTVEAVNSVDQAALFLRWQRLRKGYYAYISNQPTRDVSLDSYFETLHPKYPEKKLGRYNKNRKFYNGWIAHRVIGLKFKA